MPLNFIKKKKKNIHAYNFIGNIIHASNILQMLPISIQIISTIGIKKTVVKLVRPLYFFIKISKLTLPLSIPLDFPFCFLAISSYTHIPPPTVVVVDYEHIITISVSKTPTPLQSKINQKKNTCTAPPRKSWKINNKNKMNYNKT